MTDPVEQNHSRSTVRLAPTNQMTSYRGGLPGRNLIFQVRDTRLRTKGGGFDKFQIRSEDGTRVLIDARVLRIDQAETYISRSKRTFTLFTSAE